MVDTTKDAGVIQVLAQRLETQRLPALLSMKERVDRGEILSNVDIRLLDQIFQDAQSVQTLVDRHPEWQALAAKMVHLYKEITDLALKNEQGGTE